MIDKDPVRSRCQRQRDILGRLEEDTDAWVATASSDGRPRLVPLWFVWDEGSLLMCTRRSTPTARNLAGGRPAVVTLGDTGDVVHIEGRGELIAGSALSSASADVFSAKLGWDPRNRDAWVYLRISPQVIKAWRGERELVDRVVMRNGEWLG